VGTCQGNLHSAWDSCLVKQAVSIAANASGGQLEQQIAAAVAQLEQEITDADRADWIATGPVDWANESLSAAEAPATGYCVKTTDLCAYEAGNVALDVGEAEKTVTIDAAYVAMSTPIIRDRLKRAGVRLGHLLDEALASEARPAARQGPAARPRPVARHGGSRRIRSWSRPQDRESTPGSVISLLRSWEAGEAICATRTKLALSPACD